MALFGPYYLVRVHQLHGRLSPWKPSAHVKLNSVSVGGFEGHTKDASVEGFGFVRQIMRAALCAPTQLQLDAYTDLALSAIRE